MTTAVMDDDGGVDGRRMRRETRANGEAEKAPWRRALLSIQGWQVRQVGETLIKRRVR
jgi:hypothetical protein